MVNASPQLGSIVSALSSDTVPSGPYRNWPPFFFDGCHRRRRWSSYYVSTRLGPPPVPPIARCPSCCCSQVSSRLMRDAETSITLLSGTVHLQPPNKPVAPLQYPAPLATLPTSSCPLYANPEACLSFPTWRLADPYQPVLFDRRSSATEVLVPSFTPDTPLLSLFAILHTSRIVLLKISTPSSPWCIVGSPRGAVRCVGHAGSR